MWWICFDILKNCNDVYNKWVVSIISNSQTLARWHNTFAQRICLLKQYLKNLLNFNSSSITIMVSITSQQIKQCHSVTLCVLRLPFTVQRDWFKNRVSEPLKWSLAKIKDLNSASQKLNQAKM